LGVARVSLAFIFALVLVLSLGIFSAEPAEAKKSSGTYLTEIGSKKICGVTLCIAPLSIEEKIAAFLKSKEIHEGGIDQQIGRFSEGGVSQQAFVLESELFSWDPRSVDGQGIYQDEVLQISIQPTSLWEIYVSGETVEDRIILFKSSKKGFQGFTPFFYIVKMPGKNSTLISNTQNELENLIKDSYYEGLNQSPDTKDVIVEKSLAEFFPNKITVTLSGTMTVVGTEGGQEFPTQFESVDIITNPSGQVFMLTFNSNPKNFSQNIDEFRKSIETLAIADELAELT